MFIPWFLGVSPVIALVGQSVGQSQFPLGLGSYVQSKDDANLLQSLYSNPLPLSVPYSWYGLTTFAKSTPLRCLGVDGNQTYDVAILGMSLIERRNGRIFIDGAVY